MLDPFRWWAKREWKHQVPETRQLDACRREKDELKRRLLFLKLKAEQHIGYIELDRNYDGSAEQRGDSVQHHCP